MIIGWFSASEADFPFVPQIRWGLPTAASRSTGRPDWESNMAMENHGTDLRFWDDLGSWFAYIYICFFFTTIFYFYMQPLSDNNLLRYRGFSIARLNYQRSKSKYGHHVLTVEGTILQIFHHSYFLKDTKNRKGHRTFLAGQGLELWPWPDSPSATGCHDGIGLLSRAHPKRSVMVSWKPKWWVHVWFANYHHLLSGCLVYKSGNPPWGINAQSQGTVWCFWDLLGPLGSASGSQQWPKGVVWKWGTPFRPRFETTFSPFFNINWRIMPFETKP